MSDHVVYVCPSCEWEGEQSDLADDGPKYSHVCPLCGCADLIEESDPVA